LTRKRQNVKTSELKDLEYRVDHKKKGGVPIRITHKDSKGGGWVDCIVMPPGSKRRKNEIEGGYECIWRAVKYNKHKVEKKRKEKKKGGLYKKNR